VKPQRFLGASQRALANAQDFADEYQLLRLYWQICRGYCQILPARAALGPMSNIPEPTDDPYEPAPDPVRKALIAVTESGIISVQGIIDVANKAGCEVKIKRSALDQYIDGTNNTTSARGELARFLFRTPLGRALQSPNVRTATLFDRFFHEFLSAPSVKPEGLVDASGCYFVYHGSYLREHHVAVHLMEIDSIDDGLLVLTDSIRDDKTGNERTRTANGCVTFFLGKPHFLISGHDNRIGLNLIVGGNLVCADGSLQEMSGAMLGMTDRLEHFYRKVLIQRCPRPVTLAQVEREKLIQQTGIFRINKSRREVEGVSDVHQKAFQTLANLQPSEVFDDPMFELENVIK
jgi:hypothetical protein